MTLSRRLSRQRLISRLPCDDSPYHLNRRLWLRHALHTPSGSLDDQSKAELVLHHSDRRLSAKYVAVYSVSMAGSLIRRTTTRFCEPTESFKSESAQNHLIFGAA